MERDHFRSLVKCVVALRFMQQRNIACSAALVVLEAVSANHETRCLRDRIGVNNETGQEFLRKLFQDMPEVRVVSLIRMNIETFHVLCNLLRNVGLTEHGYVTIEEQVAMFLCTLAHDHKKGVVSSNFIRSREIVNRCFHSVLNACVKLHRQLLDSPKPVEENCMDNKWKWFKGCIGALDGNFLEIQVPESEQRRYRNWKCQVATNVLGVCTQNMNFIFVFPGWEGSASDSRVLQDALNRPNGLRVPNGNYYLVGDGYCNARGFLAPYKGIRYHLNEWCGFTPCNKEELFNFRHASARNVIARCFGVLKQRWAILRNLPWYPVKTYNRIVFACCLLHNLIRREMAIDYAEEEYDHQELENPCNDELYDEEDVESYDEEDVITSVESSTEWTNWRDNLAQQMYDEWLASGEHE